jgi:Family of unknown function (DUF6065)
MQRQNGHAAAAIPSSSDEPSLVEPIAGSLLPLVAFHGRDRLVAPEIEPAPRWRDWMNATAGRSANRCLPLLMANESGSVLKNPAAFTATWNGSDARDAILVEYDDACPANRRLASSHFGSAVLTFAVPYLFRTPPGFNLLVRGPANWPKVGICALDGLVETDWAVATFTMNWKITRPDHPISFAEDEPFCMVVPQRRGELAQFEPSTARFESDEETHRQHVAWARSRHEISVKKFLGEFSADFQEYLKAWERQYFKGIYPTGESAREHETKLRLGEFAERPLSAERPEFAEPE